MRENGIDTEINESIEEGSSWGNVVWKKIKNGFERMDLNNLYVINQKAKSLNKSVVIEKHMMTQAGLREKIGVWKNVETVIENLPNKFIYKDDYNEINSTPVYEVYERNGEISEKKFNEATGKSGGSEKVYFLAKLIVSGLDASLVDGKYTLYAEKMDEMPYKEYHRGRYTGRWFRQGLYEILFDIQTRANEIGNQIARGLEWSSKTIFRSSDVKIANNILTDLKNGDIIKSTDLQQVPVKMQGLDQLIADWNRLLEHADKLSNSYEVVMGDTMPSGTPFRLGSLLNTNARKMYDYIQQKLGLTIEDIFQEWILPDLIKNLKTKDVIRLTNDEKYLQRWYQLLVDSWYLKNLPSLPPHSTEQGMALKQFKVQEISSDQEAIINLEKGLFDDYKPRMRVVITGENVKLASDLETLSTFIQLESDPVRRTALIEIAMNKKGIDVEDLPKSTPDQLAGVKPMGMQGQGGNQGGAQGANQQVPQPVAAGGGGEGQ